MLTDTHCHLYYDEIKKDIANVLNRAEKLGVNRFICVGTNMEDSLQCLELAQKYKDIFASAGIHPHDSKNVPPDYLNQIKKFMKITGFFASLAASSALHIRSPFLTPSAYEIITLISGSLA